MLVMAFSPEKLSKQLKYASTLMKNYLNKYCVYRIRLLANSSQNFVSIFVNLSPDIFTFLNKTTNQSIRQHPERLTGHDIKP
jgi:hypothetical protein